MEGCRGGSSENGILQVEPMTSRSGVEGYVKERNS